MKVQLKKGDIVKHEESPCEVLCVWPEKQMIFIMNKRTLNASFLHPDEVEFVRRPGADVPALRPQERRRK